MKTFSFTDMLGRLMRPQNQSRAAKTVELFGWLILIEGPMFLLFPYLIQRMSFWLSLIICVVFTATLFAVYAFVLRRFGINLL